MNGRPVLVWFDRDQRLADNAALHAAATTGRPIVPVFVWAPEDEGPWPPGAASQWTLFAGMLVFFFAGAVAANWSERAGNPRFTALGSDARPGNLEGKEVRFGAGNRMHDSFTLPAGLVQLANLKTGEVVFGGIGTGLVSFLLMVFLATFISGLMVGRTPEYLGKRVEAREVKMVMLSSVAVASAILVFSALDVVVRFAPASWWNAPGPLTANLAHSGPHGLSESPHGPPFVTLLLGTIVLVTALTFFPTLALGPIAEHFLMHSAAW